MPVWFAAIGVFMAVDMVVMLATGKDIIQHATGVDIYAPIVDPIVDFLTGGSGGGGFDYDYIDEWGNIIVGNQDMWGIAITDMLWIMILGMVILALIVIFTRPKKRRYY